MRKPLKPALFATFLTFLSVAAFFLAFRSYATEQTADELESAVRESVDTTAKEIRRCAVCMESSQKGNGALVTGYAYHLSENLLRAQGFDPDVRLSFKSIGTLIDNMRAGELDMICIPAGSSPATDGEILTSGADGNCRWIVRSTETALAEKAEDWIGRYNVSARRDSLNQCFLKCYPAKRAKGDTTGRFNCISPYDSLIKVCAAEVDVDWRLLSALIFRESRFHIEARSPMGAEGLSQMIPRSARKFGVTDSFNPEMSIRGGAGFLSYLMGRYSKAGRQDRLYLALAAYNGGPGLVQSAMDSVSEAGLDPYVWENVKASSRTAASYVSGILSTYRDFCKRFPE